MRRLTRREAVATLAAAGAGLAVPASAAQDRMTAPSAVLKPFTYTVQSWKLDDLAGLNKDLMEQHYKLYTGYVNNTNKANTELAQMMADNKAESYEFSEVRRRLGFEYNGMRLHEYYFGALKTGGSAVDAKFKAAIEAVWGSWDNWRTDFVRTGMMRGIGWSILYQDPINPAALSNHWISDHEHFHPAGFNPVFVMDVWEHAYVLQFGAGGKKAYVDAFFRNIDWGLVGRRLR